MVNEDRWLTVEEICEYLQVSKAPIYKWIEQRSMPAHRVGSRWMFQRTEIDTWIKDRKAAESK